LVTLDAASASLDTYDIASTGLTKASSEPIGGSTSGLDAFLKPYTDQNRSASAGIPDPPVTAPALLRFAPPMLVGRSGDSVLMSFGTPCDGPFTAPSFVAMNLSSGELRSLKERGSKYPPFVCTNELVGASPDGTTLLLDSQSQCGRFAMTVDIHATLTDPDGYWHGGQVPYGCDNSTPKDASGNPELPNSAPILDGSQIHVHFPSGWYSHSWVTGTGQLGSADPSTPWQVDSNLWTSRTHDGKTLTYTTTGSATLNGKTIAQHAGVLWVAPPINPTPGTSRAALSPTPNATPATPSMTPTGATGYQTYRNARFGFTVQLPSNFTAGSPADNGDGLSWKSPDGSAIFGASASNNVSGDTAASQLQFCRQSVMGGGGKVTYAYADSKVWACSGFAADGSIFYDWGRVETNVEYSLTWNYPAASKSTYGPMVTHTVNTFVAGPNRTA
ncbi:MAG TPA: hypothetical protein VN108_02450, partial [Marmoricola sp.]|nr:hypothetical protein [Marmoricola sp.]